MKIVASFSIQDGCELGDSLALARGKAILGRPTLSLNTNSVEAHHLIEENEMVCKDVLLAPICFYTFTFITLRELWICTSLKVPFILSFNLVVLSAQGVAIVCVNFSAIVQKKHRKKKRKI